ncbi:MAG: DUF2147 domain-containing protein [Flavobacteriaceae bacterium]|nr:DUF2147 domain-containing protein [Bacteroidia bacterium]MBT8287461.1 DUF2147 domain-containing protein [Bacteroidia bacterium]NNF75960.1 DUF2147 domain-containing protein [Flavobacteriaceae bacterium]NNK73994.1 DUF2147 domain-containing protein [Flavobacteriaceae bacterium]
MSRFQFVLLLIVSTSNLQSQTIIGKWKTVDGLSGEQKSVVEIFERDGEVFGKIIEILNPDQKNAICKKCDGEEKNRPVLGLELIKNMKPDGKYYRKGTIFDPENGKRFRCRLVLTDDSDVLQVRGYIAFLYATQYWLRVE